MEFLIQYILPGVYFLSGIFLFRYHPLVKKGLFSHKVASALFAIKCAGGIVFTLMAFYFIPNQGDVWPWFYDSKLLWQSFWQDPNEFGKELSALFNFGKVDLESSDSDVAQNAYSGIKVLMLLLNFFTGANLIANTILFNAIASWILLYTINQLKRLAGKDWLAWSLVLIPSVIMYSSSIIKEGILFTLLAACITILIQQQYNRSTKASQYIFLLLCLFLMFIIKSFVALIFVALICWLFIAGRLKANGLIIAGSTLLVGLILFFSVNKILPSVDLPGYVIQRQQEFAELPASSKIPSPTLQNSPGSFIKAIPLAIINSVFQPLPGKGGKLIYLLYTLEIMALWIFTFYLVVKNFKRKASMPLMLLMFLLFAIVNLLFIGYIVPNVGAIVRYRSIFLPFLFIPAWYVFSASKHHSNSNLAANNKLG